jgi:dolichol-phosphate mannosyltransferase
MLSGKKIGIILPAYNEAGFITKTIKNVPIYVDLIVPVDDGSHDSTFAEIKRLSRTDKRIFPVHKAKNGGIGSAVKAGIPVCLQEKVDYVVLAAGDNQCDLAKISDFIHRCETEKYDVCRGNRFLDQRTIKKMPALRQLGNSIYSFMGKFVSGYYSLFDFLSTFSAVKREVIEKIDLNNIRNDYLYDVSVWINLNIVNARVAEISIPSIYQGEKSNINYLSFITKSFPYLASAWLNRIYLKYILIMHPVGLFYLCGTILFFFGLFFGLFVAITSIGPRTASTATVMLSVVPFILGFQLLLQAIVLDIQNEPK